MIESRADFRNYQEADRIALACSRSVRALLFNDVWRYQRCLRRLEFRLNTKANPVALTIAKLRHRRLGRRLGFSIPPNVFGPGLSISHYGTIVVNPGAKVGANCRLHVDVNIGTSAGQDEAAPTLGDNCYIGPGAKLFGPIDIGPGTAIGANAVVHKSWPDGHMTLGGVPAKQISNTGSEGLLIEAWPN
ncbi:MAG TPA: serine acetyltransferase [Chloroflexota bacterium]|nr:serine acetyltransferase [Chloroflexota bacterium]